MKSKINDKFYPLTADVAKTLREANLTAAEWRLWSYLVELDPWGDRYSNLPDVLTIMEECDIKKSTFYKAIAKFQELELFDFQALWMSFRNLFGVPKIRNAFRENGKVSENSETFPKIRKTVRENGKVSDSSENQSLNPLLNQDSSSLQTQQTVQTFHTSQIAGEGEMQATTNVIQEGVASTEVLLASEVNENSSFGQEKQSFGKDNNSGRRSIVVTECNQEGASSTIVSQVQLPQPKPYSPQKVNWRWLPEGPWNIDGKLERNFQSWLAKKWVAKYGDDIYEAKANVLSYFRNDPAKLPIKWEQYHSEFQARFENIDTRLKNGITVSPEERLNAIANARAVLPMSEEQQPTTKVAPVNDVQLPTPQLPTHPLTPSWEGELKGVGTETVLEAEITDPWEQAVAEEEQACTNYFASDNNTETYVTDEEGRRYKDLTGSAARYEKEISEQERKTVAAKISEVISALSQKMKIKSQPQPIEPRNELESLNEMLLDPVFRKDSSIIGKVKQYLSNGYLADYDDAGYPISVYAF